MLQASSWWFALWIREDLIWPRRCHPEASYSEAVRISSDTEGVILRLRIQKPWGSHLFNSLFIKTLKEWDCHVASLLAMTEWADEILTASGQSHRTPQNDGVGRWDSHVVRSKSPVFSEWLSGWIRFSRCFAPQKDRLNKWDCHVV